jgi:Ni/Co efflux regulator RcnB
MTPIKWAPALIAAGALAMTGGAAEAHKAKKHKHHHHAAKHHQPTRTVVKRVYVYEQGQRLPRDYYANSSYYVAPSAYSLPPAPYGYRYVRVGNNVYLAQTENGLITQVLTNLIR